MNERSPNRIRSLISNQNMYSESPPASTSSGPSYTASPAFRRPKKQKLFTQWHR